MAFTPTAVFAGVDFKSWDLQALDADVGGNITHGFGAAPADVYLLPLLPAAYTGTWTVTVINTTIITVAKGTATGSGDAAASVRLYVRRPHSIGA
jgi:hypothetical protein